MSDLKPVRIQLSRKKGWRKPENTVVVSRPSWWGNPYSVSEVNGEWATFWKHPTMGEIAIGGHSTKSEALRVVIDAFRGLVEDGHFNSVEVLRGHNLACWCPLDQPCHADVLLSIANE